MRKVASVALLMVAACSTKSSPSESSKVEIVVAESSWGSLAAQLGGDRVHVTSIVANPDADPHDYEPTADDARTISTAQYVVFNGVGYDEWARRVVDSNADKRQTVLDIGALVGAQQGDNPHRWYFPGEVHKVVAQIVADYKRIDPDHSSEFDRLRADFEAKELKSYDDMLGEIRTRFAGVQVGASESVFEGIADATGLVVATPKLFITAISEGIDPSLQDKATFEEQITTNAIKVLVFNPQNATPDIVHLLDKARAQGIPIVPFSETLAGHTFTDWQVDQLQQLADGLALAAGQ